MAEYLLPDVGEGLTEAEIVTWKVHVGDVIAVNDIVVEIETAKSLVELPSPYAGTVEALLVEEGSTVEVGTPLIRVGDGADVDAGDGSADPDGAPAAQTAERSATPTVSDLSNPSAGAGTQTLVGYGPKEAASQRRRRRGPATAAPPAAAPPVTPAAPKAEPAAPRPAAAVRTLAKPPVRKLAWDLGVDLTAITGTGPAGSITRGDVEAAATGASVASPALSPARDESATMDRREPIKGVRKMMAQAMVDSAFTSPHVTEWITVDVTATTELVARLRTDRRFADVKVTSLLILAKASLLAMRRTPVINSWWDEAHQEVVFKGRVNLGIAAATPRGLVVPNVKDADAMDLYALAAALDDLTETARSGRTQPADMAGGTFTITNVGVFGVDSGTPIINPGEAAILAFGATRRKPWVVPGPPERIEPRDVCTLALSFDHRHIDGEAASVFLADVAAIMSDPATALLY